MRHRTLFAASTFVAAMSALAGTAHAQRVQMPVGYRLTWIGARWQVGAKVVDASGRALAAPLTYRMADPSVASVTARGEVTARKPGNTRLWAIAGRDSASALIVVEQWPAKFSFSPASIRFDARDARQPLRVLASDSANVPIVGGTSRVSTCRSVNDRVATLSNGEVVAVANGSTWIRCSDRGIADSVRVDVQQRTTNVLISNKVALSTRARTPGDTFSVRVSARDRNGKDVSDARPTWASLNQLVVSVDPVSGRARAVGGGDTRVIVQVGDVADSVSISVSGAPIQVNTGPTVVDSGPKSKASLLVQELFVYEGETTFVAITALDSAGNSISLRDLNFRVSDTSVVAKVDTARVVGRKSGQARIYVRYAGLSDSAFVNVRQRQSGTTTTAADAEATRAAFKPPEIPDSTAQHVQARTAADRAIHTDPNLTAIRQNLTVVANAAGSIAEHLTRTETGVVEDRTGPIFGGAGSLMLFQKLEFAGAFRLGTLASVDTIGESIDFKELETSVGIFPVRQLGLRAGVTLRGEKSELATQTWMIPKVAVVSRFGFIGDVFNTYASFFILPKAKLAFSDSASLNGGLFSRGGEAGLEFRLARANGLNGGLTYYVEQIAFDESPRVESFSAIRIRFGFNIGR